MIVVSDTSPLNYLAQIGALFVLPGLFERVLIPVAVQVELRAGIGKAPVLEEVLNAPWLEICHVAPSPLLDSLMEELDRGECEAIALATELGVDFVLIDEAAGRRVAVEHGLTPVGIAGVLVEAKSRGLIPAVRPFLDRLLSTTTMRLAPLIYNQALRHAGEL